MSLPSVFNKKKEKSVTRVKTISSFGQKEVEDTVEAGLYPIKVTSRKGIKLARFALLSVILIVIGYVLFSIFGFVEPIRKLTKSLQGDNGGIFVSSEYVKVNVFLDDKLLGASPYNGQLIATGKHELKIEAADDKGQFFVPFTVPVEVFTGNVTVVTVNPAPNISLVSYTIISSKSRTNESDPLLIVKAVPDGSTVSLDGNNQGVLPVVLSSLTEGDHTVTIKKPGYKEITLDVQIAKNKTIYVESKLYEYQLTLQK